MTAPGITDLSGMRRMRMKRPESQENFRSRIRRSPAGSRTASLTSLAPGAVVDGPAIFEADLGDQIDNMEGIDAHVTPEGETVLTLISDDNFSMIERTLLLQFTLVD